MTEDQANEMAAQFPNRFTVEKLEDGYVIMATAPQMVQTPGGMQQGVIRAAAKDPQDVRDAINDWLNAHSSLLQ